MTPPAAEASGSGEQKEAPETVFGYVDQQVMVSRIDTVDDDDLASCFFGDSIQDVADAATRMFDVGVRDKGTLEKISGASSFAVPEGLQHAPEDPASARDRTVAAAELEASRVDAAARQAFILGGPAAMKRG